MSKELLFSITKKDFEWDYFRAGGSGGQNQNTTDSACRCVHRESGAVGESREHREQSQNRKEAFRRCVQSPQFQSWIIVKASMLYQTESVDQKIEKLLDEKNMCKVNFK